MVVRPSRIPHDSRASTVARLITVPVFAVILLASGTAMIRAQQPDAKKPETPVKYTEVKYSADASSYKWEGDDRILVLTGNVKFVQGDTTVVADRVDYRESTRTATASGNLRMYDDLNTITGNLGTVYFKDKKGVLTGSVVMTAKPKPADAAQSGEKSIQSELKDETTITCDALDYFYKDKRAVVPKAVKIVQKTRIVTADSAIYLGKDEIVELTGNVKGVDEKDRHNFAAPKVRISLKEGAQWIEAEKATGTFYIKEDETEPAPAATTPAK